MAQSKDTKDEAVKAEETPKAAAEAAVSAAPAKEYIQNKDEHSIFISSDESPLFLKPGYPQKLEGTTLEELSAKFPHIKRLAAAGKIVMLTKAEAEKAKKKIDIEFKKQYPDFEE